MAWSHFEATSSDFEIDVFIADVAVPAYAKLIPEWYGQLVGARAFVMLPLMSGGKVLGMLYGDYDAAPASAPGGTYVASTLKFLYANEAVGRTIGNGM